MAFSPMSVQDSYIVDSDPLLDSISTKSFHVNVHVVCGFLYSVCKALVLTACGCKWVCDHMQISTCVHLYVCVCVFICMLRGLFIDWLINEYRIQHTESIARLNVIINIFLSLYLYLYTSCKAG